MKKICIAITALAALIAAPAFAADMAVKAPPPPPAAPVWSWAGLYIGADIGWSQINDSQALSSPAFALTVPNRASGVLGGGHAGYNFQTGPFVYGLEADIDGSSIKGTYQIGAPFLLGTFGTDQLQWQGSVRGRLGVAADRALFYGTGGWAFGHFTDGYNSAVNNPVFVQSVSSDRNGWTVGAGIEYALTNNFIGRVEYRYTDWGTHTNNLNVFLAPPGLSLDRVTENQVTVGISYKFGGPTAK